MHVKFALALLILFSTTSAWAENDSFIAGWNRWWSGRCSDVTNEDVNQAAACLQRKVEIPKNTITTASEMLEDVVFQEAAARQIPRDKCLSEQIGAMQASPKWFNVWKSYLFYAWLGKKKAEATWNLCQHEFLDKVTMKDKWEAKGDLAAAWDKVHEQEKHWRTFDDRLEARLQKYKKVCYDQDKIDALWIAPKLFERVPPIVSSPILFRDIEQSRDMIVHTQDRQPVTDEDMIDMNLTDLQGITVKDNKVFSERLQTALSALKNNRTQSANSIADHKNADGSFDLNEGTKNYLFSEGTAAEVLAQSFSNGPEHVKSRAESCMLADYKPGGVGGVAEFGATSVITGGIFYALFKGSVLFKGVTTWRALNGLAAAAEAAKTGTVIKRSLQAGALAAGVKGMVTEAIDRCRPAERKEASGAGRSYDTLLTDQTNLSMKAENLGKKYNTDGTPIATKPGDLSDEFDFRRVSIPFEPSETPSCKGNEISYFLANFTARANCNKTLGETALNLLPLKVLIPAELLFTDEQ